jgi:hypothetical protein
MGNLIMGKYWNRAAGVSDEPTSGGDQATVVQPTQDGGGKYWRRATGASETPETAPSREAAPSQGFFAGVKEMVQGKHDPRYAGVGTIYGQFPGDLEGPMGAAATMGAGDDALGDVVAKSLGDKVIRRERDAHGQEVFVTRGPDGAEQRGYLNAPGLDSQDVVRGVRGTLPYFATLTPVGSALRGAAAVVRVGGQAAAAGSTSIAGDVASGALGSEQGVDYQKAAINTLAAGAGEAVTPAFSAVWRRFVTEPKLYNRATGQLTAEGAAAAKAAGYDPAQMTADIQREFAKTYAKTGGDASSAIAAATDAEWKIPSTLGQRTKDQQQLLDEKAMRMGVQGQAAKETMERFDKDQAQAIRSAVLDSGPDVTGMAQRIAPNRTGAEMSPSTLGPEIRAGMRGAQGAARAGEREAWDKVSDLTPKPQAFGTLPDMLAGRLGDLPVDEVNTRAAAQMAKALDDYVSGKAISKPVAGVLKQTPVTTLDQMRRRLLAMSQSADNATDQRAARAIYDGFNDWIDDAASKALVNGDVDAAAALRSARDVTKTMRSIFSPTDLRGHATPGARRLDDVLQRSDSAEGIVSGLFGGGPAANIPDGTVEALKLMRTGLSRYAKSDAAKQTWNDVRAVYWTRLVRDKTGEVFTPGVMLRNLKLAQNHQGSVMQELYTPAERGAIMRLRTALEQVVAKDPNPSGSGTAIAAYARQFLGNVLAAIPGGQVAWQYSGIPSAMGKAAATRAVRQLPESRNALLGPWAAAGSNTTMFEGDTPEPHRNALMPRQISR